MSDTPQPGLTLKRIERWAKIMFVITVPGLMVVYGTCIETRLKEQNLTMQREAEEGRVAQKYVEIAKDILQQPMPADAEDHTAGQQLLRTWAAELLDEMSPIGRRPELVAAFQSGEASFAPQVRNGQDFVPFRGGIGARTSTTVLAYSELGGTGRDRWQVINNIRFWALPLDPPSGYYEEVEKASSSEFRNALHSCIAGHQVLPYSHRSRPGDADHVVDVWDVLALADAYPEDPTLVLDIYLNGTFIRQLSGTRRESGYDREMIWPKSLGFADNTRKNAAYSDCHNIFAAYRSYNASRRNKPYGNGEADPQHRKATLQNLGRGGGLTLEPDSSNFSFLDVWQTWVGRRGDVARAVFYMDVRYDGAVSEERREPDLRLTDDIARIIPCNVWDSGGEAFMGVKSALMQWHMDDPVDDLERKRNTVVYLFQGNRNPFIDHPEWVGKLFGDQ